MHPVWLLTSHTPMGPRQQPAEQPRGLDSAVIVSAPVPHGHAVHEASPGTAVILAMADLTLSTRWSMSILMSTKMYMQGTEVMSTGTKQLWP